MAAGRNPRSVALEIVGRVNKATGLREGGLIGLNAPQSAAVKAAREELADPARMAGYFERARRDRRFDRVVSRALADGKPLAKPDIDRVTARYADRLLKLRGDTIARTEMIASLAAGRDEGIRQLIDTGAVRSDQVVKVWRATGDRRTRDTHMDMDGAEVSIDGLFQSPSGALLAYPGDISNGAPAEEVINCRCYSEVKIDFLTGVR